MSQDCIITTQGPAVAAAGKYLTFLLGEDRYGIPVLSVREIIRLIPVTLVAQMPTHVRGVINLRGKIVAVIDLRLRLGLSETPSTEQTCIVVCEGQGGGRKPAPMGLIVDGVEEVVHFGEAEIESPPDLGVQAYGGYIVGMAKVRGAVKTLLNVDRILDD